MATWVNLNRAAKFPDIIRSYKKAGRGQGNTINSTIGFSPTVGGASRGFLLTVKRFVNESNGAALPAWIRKMPGGGSNDWQNVQVDVSAIPGVRPLRAGGKWVNYTG